MLDKTTNNKGQRGKARQPKFRQSKGGKESRRKGERHEWRRSGFLFDFIFSSAAYFI